MRERVVRRAFRRALVAAVTLAIASAAFTSADTLVAGDILDPPPPVDLGQVAPGATIVYDLPFTLACGSVFAHINRNQVVTLTPVTQVAPTGGSLTATTSTLGPPPGDWPLDGDACSTANTPFASTTPSRVTIVAPPADGEDYLYQVGYMDSFEPPSGNDGSAISGSITFASFILDVVSNTAPVLQLPSAVTLEGDTAGGALAAYTATATDAEDDPDPTPVCMPAPGAFVPLGTTQVDCTVTDSGGQTASGSFDLAVVDTTAPALHDVPTAVDVTAASALGTVVTYATPSAVDVVDPNPVVSCAPASGTQFPIGTTVVGCTATDDSGNSASAAFAVTVRFVAARWESPIGGDPAWLVSNHGRTVPVKLALLVSGRDWTSGSVALVVTSCGGASVHATVPMAWNPDSGRWMGHLNTSLLPGSGCYTGMASPNGTDGPTFTLDLRPPAELSAPGRAKRG